MQPASQRERLLSSTVFIDRSLGGVVVARALRAAGLTVVTMAEHYGRDAAQLVADVDWIRDAGQRGWVLFHQDKKIRTRLAEIEAVRGVGARMFCVMNGNLTGEQAAGRFVTNLDAIDAELAHAGPFICGIYSHGVEPLAVR